MFFADAIIPNGERRQSFASSESSEMARVVKLAHTAALAEELSAESIAHNAVIYDKPAGDSIFASDSESDDDNGFSKRPPARISSSSPHRRSPLSFSSLNDGFGLQPPSLSLGSLPPSNIGTPNKAKLKRSTLSSRTPKDVWWSITFLTTTPFLLFLIPAYNVPRDYSSSPLLGGPMPPDFLMSLPSLALLLTCLALTPITASILFNPDPPAQSLPPANLILTLAHPNIISKLILFGLLLASLILTPSYALFLILPLTFATTLLKLFKKLRHRLCPTTAALSSSTTVNTGDNDAANADSSTPSQTFLLAVLTMGLEVTANGLKQAPLGTPSSQPVNHGAAFPATLKQLTHISIVLNFVIVGLGLHLGLLPLLQYHPSQGLPLLPFTGFLFAVFWVTATIRRVIGLVSCCGVYSWFEKQGNVVDELQLHAMDEEEDDGTNFRMVSRPSNGYGQIGGDDDSSDPSTLSAPSTPSTPTTRGLQHTGLRGHLLQALSVSFGSVCKCAVMGALGQAAWQLIRSLEAIETMRMRRGFKRMNVGEPSSNSNLTYPYLRSFVRAHNDYGLAHCAAYCKSYKRAALDVADLIEQAKLEPVLAQDRVTATCNSCCTTIAGCITLFMCGLLLAAGVGDCNNHQVAAILLICFVQTYVVLFTVLEGVRASVKAIYVCYAESPAALSQEYPTIFHRLARVVEEHDLT